MDNFTDVSFPEPYKSIRNYLNKSIIGIVLLSVLGNIMIIKVMLRKDNRHSSTSTFFMTLAISDMSIALFISLERWLHWTFRIDLFYINPRITTIKTIFNYSNIQISTWILVCITVERLISINMPFRFKEICKVKRAFVIILVICVLIISSNTIQFTLIVDAVVDLTLSKSEMVGKVKNGATIVIVVDAIVSFFFPFAIIIVSSIYISIQLHRQQKSNGTGNRNMSVTMILLAANIVFVLTSSPFVLLQLVSYSVNIDPFLFWTLFDIFIFLADMNSALNFYVYVLSGSKFRSDVKQILGFLETQSSSY